MAISSKLPSALGARPWAVRRVREAPGRQTPLPRGGGGGAVAPWAPGAAGATAGRGGRGGLIPSPPTRWPPGTEGGEPLSPHRTPYYIERPAPGILSPEPRRAPVSTG